MAPASNVSLPPLVSVTSGEQEKRTDNKCQTFATRLAEDGASATEIQALLGHESLNTSQSHIDAIANQARQAARANRTDRALERISPANSATRRGC